MQISEPPTFVEHISVQLGLFYTTGFEEDHKARSNGVFADDEFLQQATIVLEERPALFEYAVEDYDDGLLFFHFSSSDLQSHMFWWDSDAPHLRETPLPMNSGVRAVETDYPDRTAWTSGSGSWLVYWFVASLVAALCVRPWFKMVSQLLYYLPATEQYRIIFMQRDLDEVLMSQEKMLARRNATAAPRGRMKEAFTMHLERLFAWFSQQPHMNVLVVRHRELLGDTRNQAETINGFLGGALAVPAMIEAIDPQLYRNRTP